VVILCTIIFIYEKKRNKDASVDEDPAQDGWVFTARFVGVATPSIVNKTNSNSKTLLSN
jgi:hypothetical protein